MLNNEKDICLNQIEFLKQIFNKFENSESYMEAKFYLLLEKIQKSNKAEEIEFLDELLAKLEKYDSYDQAKIAIQRRILIEQNKKLEKLINCYPENQFSKSSDLYIPSKFNKTVMPIKLFDWDFFKCVLRSADETCEYFEDGVAIDGHGPFEFKEFEELLQYINVERYAVGGYSDVVVLGRYDWSKDDLNEHINNLRGRNLKVYSQEMFLAQVLSLQELYNDKDILKRFAIGHPALEYLINGGFDWPETTIVPGSGFGELDDADEWPYVGLLKHMGYHVGKSGIGEYERRKILREIFLSSRLPNVISHEYMEEWGEAESSKRLHKMANSIASFARNAKRRPKPPELAIEEWEEDLDWIRQQFYHGACALEWPSTFVKN